MRAGRDGVGEEGRLAREREPSRPLSTHFRIQKKKKRTQNKPILLTGGADQVLHQISASIQRGNVLQCAS
jgi:hypothetical protein